MYDGPGTEEELTAEEVNLLLDGIERQVGQKNRGSVQITSVSFADFITYLPVVLGQPRDAEPMDRVKPAHASFNGMYVEKIDGLSGLDELDIELQSSYEGKVRRFEPFPPVFQQSVDSACSCPAPYRPRA
jgi:hypothetical protein